jgi:hypothetical protein
MKNPTAYWDGVSQTETAAENSDRQNLASYAKEYNWHAVLKVLAARPELVNATRPGSKTLYAPLHQAAHGGAEINVVSQLISLGAWRTLRNAKGAWPLDIAKEKGHAHLLDILEPVHKRSVPEQTLARMQGRFHDLIREVAKDLIFSQSIRLPELEPMLEFERMNFWFPVPGMYGGFYYWLVFDGPEARLTVQSWCRVTEGSGRQHDITEQSTTLVDKGFV